MKLATFYCTMLSVPTDTPWTGLQITGTHIDPLSMVHKDINCLLHFNVLQAAAVDRLQILRWQEFENRLGYFFMHW